SSVSKTLRSSIGRRRKSLPSSCDIVAEELTINGHVKGTLHANRVRLGGTGVVEGDIFHRTLAIEENARFEGMSRRNENAIDMQTLAQTNGKGNGTPVSLNPVS